VKEIIHNRKNLEVKIKDSYTIVKKNMIITINECYKEIKFDKKICLCKLQQVSNEGRHFEN
jgi:hypothetical protein